MAKREMQVRDLSGLDVSHGLKEQLLPSFGKVHQVQTL